MTRNRRADRDVPALTRNAEQLAAPITLSVIESAGRTGRSWVAAA